MNFSNHHQTEASKKQFRGKCSGLTKCILMFLATIIVASLINQPTKVEALWLFQQSPSVNGESSSTTNEQQQQPTEQAQVNQAQQVVQETGLKSPQVQQTGSFYSGYGSSLLSIAGIHPSSIASLLNTVGDTGFRYFNIQDQCRNRAACDLGSMLFKKLSFVHNWLIRTSVRTLTDMNNIYTQSWMEGMLGKNCTTIYATCRESPLEGLMNLAMLQHLAANA